MAILNGSKTASADDQMGWLERVRHWLGSDVIHVRRAEGRRGFHATGVAGKMLLSMALVGLPVTIIAAWLVYSSGTAEQFDRAQTNLSTNIATADSRFVDSVAGARSDILFLSHLPSIEGILRAAAAGNADGVTAWKERVATVFSDMLASRSEYFQLRYIDVTGQEVVRVDRLADGTIAPTPEADLQAKGDRPYFTETAALVAGDIYISAIDLNREQGEIEVPHRPTYRVATPVYDADGAYHGIVIVNIASDQAFSDAASSVGGDTSFFIANQDGDYLVNPDASKTFGFDLGQRYLIQDDIPALAPLFDGGADEVDATVDLPSGRYVLAAQRSYFDLDQPSRYLVLASLLPINAVAGSDSRLYGTAAIIAVILLFAGLTQFVVLMRLVVRPLGRMHHAVRDLGSGSRSVNLDDLTGRKDEVGDLARGFEGMAAKIADREEELVEKADELAQSNQELSQFAYVASHDLQEPLRMVASYLGLLSSRYQGKLDQEADEFIGYAVDGAERMKRLINDLLAYSRANNRALNVEPVAAASIVDRVIDTYRAKIEEAGAEVVVDPLPEIRVDETQVERLFANLLDNALKYRANAAPKIRILAKRDGRFWEFTVADNGIGIDPKFQSKVFEIFARLHGRHEYPGTGIGLASCRRVVERHGGKIWIQSTPGGGSEFHFTLPQARSK